MQCQEHKDVIVCVLCCILCAVYAEGVMFKCGVLDAMNLIMILSSLVCFKEFVFADRLCQIVCRGEGEDEGEG